MGLKIGQLARQTRTNSPTIRYYEDIGLMPTPSRVDSQRRYGSDDVRRLPSSGAVAISDSRSNRSAPSQR